MDAAGAAITERVGYVSSGDGDVYCLVSAPVRGARDAVVLLGPLAEEKKSSLRPLVEMARAVARAGFVAVRVDFRGTGDASGLSQELSVGSMIEDALAAVAFARSECAARRVGLLGLRLGGAVAVLAAGRARPDALVLVEPVVSGRTYLRSLSRRQAIRRMLTSGSGTQPEADGEAPQEGGGALDLDGLALNRDFLAKLEEVDITRVAVEVRSGGWPAALVVQVGARAEPSREFTVLGEAFGGSARVEAVVTSPFWLQTDYVDPAPVTERVVAFLSSTFGAPDDRPRRARGAGR